MSIHEKVVQLARLTRKKAQGIFQKTQMDIIVRIVAHLNQRSHIYTADLEDAIEPHAEAASALDAASYLLEQLPLRGLKKGKPTNHRIPAVTSQKDVISFLKGVESSCSKGCVYVAWTSKPFEFVYVGKAGADQGGLIKRLTDKTHHALFDACRTAQWLSLIYTKKTTPNTLFRLEACVIELYHFLRKEGLIKRGKRGEYMPPNNTQHPKKHLHQGEAFTEIRRIIRSLTKAAEAIEKREYGSKMDVSEQNLSEECESSFAMESTASPEPFPDASPEPLPEQGQELQAIETSHQMPEQTVKEVRFFKKYKPDLRSD
jgi:hypothetical protein